MDCLSLMNISFEHSNPLRSHSHTMEELPVKTGTPPPVGGPSQHVGCREECSQ